MYCSLLHVYYYMCMCVMYVCLYACMYICMYVCMQCLYVCVDAMGCNEMESNASMHISMYVMYLMCVT